MIRAARLEDCSKLYDVYLSGTNSGHAHEPARYELQDFEIAVSDPRSVLLVAVLDDVPVGFALGYDLKSWFYLDVLCVAREARNQGLGTALLHELRGRFEYVEACFYAEDAALRRFIVDSGCTLNVKQTTWFRL